MGLGFRDGQGKWVQGCGLGLMFRGARSHQPPPRCAFPMDPVGHDQLMPMLWLCGFRGLGLGLRVYRHAFP